MNMQNLIQLEEVLAGLQQTLLNGKGEEADLVLRVQQVEDYVADGQLIAVRGQPLTPSLRTALPSCFSHLVSALHTRHPQRPDWRSFDDAHCIRL
jgi:hypothetical protein